MKLTQNSSDFQTNLCTLVIIQCVPSTTWLRTIDEDVQPQQFGVHTAWSKARDGKHMATSRQYDNGLPGVFHPEEEVPSTYPVLWPTSTARHPAACRWTIRNQQVGCCRHQKYMFCHRSYWHSFLPLDELCRWLSLRCKWSLTHDYQEDRRPSGMWFQ